MTRPIIRYMLLWAVFLWACAVPGQAGPHVHVYPSPLNRGEAQYMGVDAGAPPRKKLVTNLKFWPYMHPSAQHTAPPSAHWQAVSHRQLVKQCLFTFLSLHLPSLFVLGSTYCVQATGPAGRYFAVRSQLHSAYKATSDQAPLAVSPTRPAVQEPSSAMPSCAVQL
jgi:hypothetical protein